MAPTIHLVRHAQGLHNISHENESIRDPSLTPQGLTQCTSLRNTFPHHSQITTIVASPLRRTIHTAINSFGSEDKYPIILLDLLQEVSDAPCDTGSEAEKLREEFGGKIDGKRCREGWTEKGKGSMFEPTLAKLISRGLLARKALRELAGDKEGHVVATTHGGFLHFLTDDWADIPSGAPTGWDNCEYRSYQFVDPTGQDEEAALVETEESWQRRKGSSIPATETEKREMRSVIQQQLAPLLKFQP